MSDEELRAEAKRRGYALIPVDRLKMISATIELVTDPEVPIAEIASDYLIHSLGNDIAERLREFNKISWGPADRWTMTRSASARFYVVVPRDAKTPV